MNIEIGAKAPEFKALSDDGSDFSFSDFLGRWVVLYFYPKDDTPGCTREACGFRDNMERITSIGAAVIGVSPDSSSSHIKFREKFDLNFTLLSDTDKAICNLYGVIGEKKQYGKTYLGLIRSTFIIDDKGIVRHVYSNVKVDGHVDSVIKKIEELKEL
ncbi:MAG: thioredoxin-dependent peroxiredoxin [Bacteroidota bacterium]|nr:thioredoxin-dependent peroxiredoxin [Bacteroidota bacterium]